MHVAGEACIGHGTAQNVKPGIAEGGNCQKEGDPDAFRPILGHKHRQHQQRARQLKPGRQPHHHAQQSSGLRQAAAAHRFPHQLQGAVILPAGEAEGEKAGEGYQPQAADLNHGQHHGLAETGEGAVGVHRHQAGYAGGAHGGEQCVKGL